MPVTTTAIAVDADKQLPDFQFLSAHFAEVADGVNPLALLNLYNLHQGLNQPAARSAFNAKLLSTQVKLLAEICTNNDKPINNPASLLIASYYLWAGYDLTTSFEFSVERSITLLTADAKDINDPRISGAIKLLNSLIRKNPGNKKEYDEHVMRAVCFAPYFCKPSEFNSFLQRWQSDVEVDDMEFYSQLRNLYELVLKPELNTLLSTAGLPKQLRKQAGENIFRMRGEFKSKLGHAVKRRGKGTQGKRLVKLSNPEILAMADGLDQRNYRQLADFFIERIKNRAAMIRLNQLRQKTAVKPATQDIIDRDWQEIAPYFTPAAWAELQRHYGPEAKAPVNWDLLRDQLKLAERLRNNHAGSLAMGMHTNDALAVKIAAFFLHSCQEQAKAGADYLATSAITMQQLAANPNCPVIQRAADLIKQATATTATHDKASHAVRMIYHADFYTNRDNPAFVKRLEDWCWHGGVRFDLAQQRKAIKARAVECAAQFAQLPEATQKFIADVYTGKIRAANNAAGQHKRRDPNAGPRIKKLRSGAIVIQTVGKRKPKRPASGLNNLAPTSNKLAQE